MGGRFGGLVSDISDLDQIDGDIISKDFMVTLIANYLLSFLVVLYLSAHNSAIVFSLGTVL